MESGLSEKFFLGQYRTEQGERNPKNKLKRFSHEPFTGSFS